jgi:hypothetical protein
MAYGIAVTYSFVALFVCLIIGLPTFFTGCGTNIPNTCFTYYQTFGTVYGSKITSSTCSECVKRDNNKKCTQTNYYTCYDGYVKIFYNWHGANKTCLYDAYYEEKSFTDVQNKLAYYYPKGTKDKLFVSKTDFEDCSMDDDGLQGLTYVGIIFLSLSGVFLIIFSYFYFLDNTQARVAQQKQEQLSLETFDKNIINLRKHQKVSGNEVDIEDQK